MKRLGVEEFHINISYTHLLEVKSSFVPIFITRLQCHKFGSGPRRRKGDKSVYLIMNMLKGVKPCYQKIKCFTLAIVVTTGNLITYYKGLPIIINTSYPIKQVLKKPNMAGRIVVLLVELFEYEITSIA